MQVLSPATASKTARLLLQIHAVKLNVNEPFQWASGIRSPIYCDNRLTLSFPEIRSYLCEQFVEIISTHYSGAELIAAVATAGIAHGALIAQKLELPFCYVRSSAKDHGMKNTVEGLILKNQKCVVIEDLVSTGGSSLRAVKVLRENEVDVLGMASIFTYGFEEAEENFRKENCPLVSLTDYPSLLPEAIALQQISEHNLAALNAWRLSPKTWKA